MSMKLASSYLLLLTWGILSGADVYAHSRAGALTKLQNAHSRISDINVSDWSPVDEDCQLITTTLVGNDPVSGKDWNTYVQFYDPLKSKKGKTILLLPPTGGENDLDRGYASFFCKNGYNVAIVSWDLQTALRLDLDTHDDGALRAVAAIHNTLAALKLTATKSVYLFGTSVGAITGSLVTGLEAEITKAVLIVGGGGMSEIIAKSTEEGLTKLREARMQEFNYSGIEQYQLDLEKTIAIDPLDFTNYTGKKDILMVVALNDLTVPTKNQLELASAWGTDKILSVKGAHLPAILFSYAVYKKKFLDFFDR